MNNIRKEYIQNRLNELDDINSKLLEDFNKTECDVEDTDAFFKTDYIKNQKEISGLIDELLVIYGVKNED